MGLDYAHEKLMIAVDVLATTPGRIQERLYWAFQGFLTLRVSEDFPKDLQPDFERLYASLTKPKSGDDTPRARKEGPAKIACEELSDEEGREAANLVPKLYHEVDDRLREER
jgi:hypothetical protein